MQFQSYLKTDETSACTKQPEENEIAQRRGVAPREKNEQPLTKKGDLDDDNDDDDVNENDLQREGNGNSSEYHDYRRKMKMERKVGEKVECGEGESFVPYCRLYDREAGKETKLESKK